MLLYDYRQYRSTKIQVMFHAYLNKFEIAITHLFLNMFLIIVINKGKSDLQEHVTKKESVFY